MSAQLFDESKSKTGEENQENARIEPPAGEAENIFSRIIIGFLLLVIVTICGDAIIRFMQGKSISAGLTAIALTAAALLAGFSYLLENKR